MDKALSPTDRVICCLLLMLGYSQHRIASLFDVNQGRVSEVNKKFQELQ